MPTARRVLCLRSKLSQDAQCGIDMLAFGSCLSLVHDMSVSMMHRRASTVDKRRAQDM
jgi:hypothetical protein